MSGSAAGVSTTAVGGVGVALLPATGNTRPLFIVAATLLVGGLVTLLASGLVTLKSRKSEAK
jgi:hypothetical protein